MRRSLSQKERAEMYDKQGGHCANGYCSAPVLREAMIAEHTWPVALGNPEKPDCLLCLSCAARKTNGNLATTYGSDSHEIAKTKRLRKRASGEGKKVKRKIQSRGFDKSLRKKMNGDVVRVDG